MCALLARRLSSSTGSAQLVRNAYKQLETRLNVRSAPGAWFEVSQERISRFGDTIEDRQWIHCDPERATRESPFGTTIAHGNLILCLAPYLPRADDADGEIPGLPPLEGVKRGVNYGWNKIRFMSPVPSGAQIRVSHTLKELEILPPASLHLVSELLVEVQGSEKPCMVAETVGRAIFE